MTGDLRTIQVIKLRGPTMSAAAATEATDQSSLLKIVQVQLTVTIL